MQLVVYLIGAVALVNCVCDLATGKMYFFFKAPDEFLGAMRTISRDNSPVAFWVFFLGTLAFGGFFVHFANTQL